MNGWAYGGVMAGRARAARAGGKLIDLCCGFMFLAKFL
jgi:hypothetical protein